MTARRRRRHRGARCARRRRGDRRAGARCSAPAPGRTAWRSPPAPRPTRAIVPFRGAYLRLRPSARELVRALIYPVPDPCAAVPRRAPHPPHRRRRLDRADRADGRRPRRLPPEGRRPRDLPRRSRWPGTWRMARRWWRTGLTEMRHAVSRAACVRAAQRYVPELTAERRRARPTPASAPRPSARDGSLVDDFVFSQHRARAARAQRALARRHLVAGDRAPDRGPRGGGLRPLHPYRQPQKGGRHGAA